MHEIPQLITHTSQRQLMEQLYIRLQELMGLVLAEVQALLEGLESF